MLSLDEQDFYVWRGPERLELSDSGHEASEILHQGQFFIWESVEDSMGTQPVSYLACQEGIRYRVYSLPQGLPTSANRLVDIQESKERLTKSQLAVGLL